MSQHMRSWLLLAILLAFVGCSNEVSVGANSSDTEPTTNNTSQENNTDPSDTHLGSNNVTPDARDSSSTRADQSSGDTAANNNTPDTFTPDVDEALLEPPACEPSEEVCDGLDNDCNGQVDEIACSCTGEYDCYGGPDETRKMGECQDGTRECPDGEFFGDCSGWVGPEREVCDGLDNDCDGEVDEYLLNSCGDCGSDPIEVCDYEDNDCDGEIDEGLRNPCNECGAVPDEVCDYEDNDCDGETDEGLRNACNECGPLPEEVCDGLDNDCDGDFDEGFPLLRQVCDSDDSDLCENGRYECLLDGSGVYCAETVTDIPEICDGIDNDCDEEYDEGFDLVGVPCDGDDSDVCENGTFTCSPDGLNVECVNENPADIIELCDGEDNDCDGEIDEDFPTLSDECDGDDEDLCANGTLTCTADGLGVECANDITLAEICDREDNDCDGEVDEDFPLFNQPCDGDDSDLCPNGRYDCSDDGLGVVCGRERPEDIEEECWDGEDNDCDGVADENCFETSIDPTAEGDRDDGLIIISASDGDNPSDRRGVTLSRSSFIPPYLWAANHDYDTVTKFNVETFDEDGRYWVADNPSRTAVDLDGNMWVGGRNDGRLSKVLWDRSSCPDRNNNNQIDSSNGTNVVNSAGNPLADECVVYSEVPNGARTSIRGIAADPQGRMWIGYTGGGVQSIDPYSFNLGAFHDDNTIPRYAPDGSGVYQPTGATGDAGGVYGLVVDADGMLYTSGYSRQRLAKFNTNTEDWVALYDIGCGSYGIAVDAKNRIFLGGWPNCGGIGMYDPAQNRFYGFTVPNGTVQTPGGQTAIQLVMGTAVNDVANFEVTGVAAHPETGDIFMSFFPIGYTGRLHINENDYSASTLTFIGTLYDSNNNRLPGVNNNDLRGVGFDANGDVWTLGLSSGKVWKIDPNTNQRAADLPNGTTVGEGSHYTYSDFTGSTALSFTAPRGYWRYIYDTHMENARLDRIVWEAYVPDDTTAGLKVRALDSSGRATTSWEPGTNSYFDYPEGRNSDDIDLDREDMEGSQFEIELRITTTDRDVRPIIHEINLFWNSNI